MLRLWRAGRAVAAGALLAGAVAAGPASAAAPAQAPKCPGASVQESTRAAKAVFSGEVTGAERQGRNDGRPGVSYLQDVTVSRVYQGAVSTETVQVLTDDTPGECSTGKLKTGKSYLFFAQGEGDPWTATGGVGAKRASDRVVRKVEEILGSGRDPVPPVPETAEFTRVGGGEPPTLSRAAAPGLALVLVGLLGLIVVGRFGRRGRA